MDAGDLLDPFNGTAVLGIYRADRTENSHTRGKQMGGNSLTRDNGENRDLISVVEFVAAYLATGTRHQAHGVFADSVPKPPTTKPASSATHAPGTGAAKNELLLRA